MAKKPENLACGIALPGEHELYSSRKNRVFRTRVKGHDLVAKIFSPERAHLAENEYALLQECQRHGIKVPRPLSLEGTTLLMEVVDGVTVGDRIDALWDQYLSDDPEAVAAMTEIVEGVSGWLAHFHKAFGFKRARGDTILRNFVIGEGGSITGLDLEESIADGGDPIDDIAQLCAFTMAMHPSFTKDRLALAGRFADKYWSNSGSKRDRTELGPAIARALRHYAQFREDADELLAWADRFETGQARL